MVACPSKFVSRTLRRDKIAGWICRHGVDSPGKILYTTGRFTSENDDQNGAD
jgi:formate dehydrogenase assembly factor FdhD